MASQHQAWVSEQPKPITLSEAGIDKNLADRARWSDREIAKTCDVDHKTVGKLRSEVTGEIPSERTYTTKHGAEMPRIVRTFDSPERI